MIATGGLVQQGEVGGVNWAKLERSTGRSWDEIKLSEISIKGVSGQKYKYAAYSIENQCRELAGVYVITHRVGMKMKQIVWGSSTNPTIKTGYEWLKTFGKVSNFLAIEH